MTMQPFNAFQDFLEESDVGQRANFFSRAGTGGTPTRTRFFENQFANIQNQFLGALGAQIRGGEQPTTVPTGRSRDVRT